MEAKVSTNRKDKDGNELFIGDTVEVVEQESYKKNMEFCSAGKRGEVLESSGKDGVLVEFPTPNGLTVTCCCAKNLKKVFK